MNGGREGSLYIPLVSEQLPDMPANLNVLNLLNFN